jgi:hypothetical protein
MVLTTREKYIGITAAAAVGVWALYSLVSSYLAQRDVTEASKGRLVAEVSRQQDLISQRRQADARWRQMLQSGMKSDPAEAESQILHAIRDWAEESGVSLSLLQPDRRTEKSRLPQIQFQADGTGTMQSIGRLLFRVQTATIPIKVTEMRVVARKVGTDDLSVHLGLSTVYAPGHAIPATAPAVASPVAPTPAAPKPAAPTPAASMPAASMPAASIPATSTPATSMESTTAPAALAPATTKSSGGNP